MALGLSTCSARCEARYQQNWRGNRKIADERRGSSTARGYDSRWQRYRETYIRENRLCARCAARDEARLVEHVDHIVPVQGGRADPLFDVTSNHQGLCRDCHVWKTAKCDDAIRKRYDLERSAGASEDVVLDTARHLWELLRDA